MFKFRMLITRNEAGYLTQVSVNGITAFFQDADRMVSFKMGSSFAWRIMK